MDLEDKKNKINLDMVKACKQFVRKYGDFLNIEAKYSENIYYSTDKYSIKKWDDEIFTVKVKRDQQEGIAFAGFEFFFNMGYNFYMPASRSRNLKFLYRLLKRKAEKQKKMIALRNEAVQKLNNSVEYIKKNIDPLVTR